MGGNPNHDGPSMHPRWAELWSKLECNALHNVFKNHACTDTYTIEECEQFLRTNDTCIQFRGEYRIHLARQISRDMERRSEIRGRPDRDGDTRTRQHPNTECANHQISQRGDPDRRPRFA
eukprot:scaffold119755_cov41-Tisochrysis_lutea.AAC.1